MIACTIQGGALLDRQVDAFCYAVAMPAIHTCYRTVAECSIAISGLFSKRLSQLAYNAFYDPFGANSLLFVTRPFERLTHYIAMRTPLASPRLLCYFDRSMVSMCQALHGYISKVNVLLAVPKNLALFVQRLNTETFLLQINTWSHRVVVAINIILIQARRLVLAVVKAIIALMDLALGILCLSTHFHLFTAFTQAVLKVRSRLHAKLAKSVVHAIERRERKIRQVVFSIVAHAVVGYCVNRAAHVAVKSLIGRACFRLSHMAMTRYLHAPEWAVHLLGLSITAHLAWANLIKPTFDPYFYLFQPAYKSSKLSFYKFCSYFRIETFHLYMMFLGNSFNELGSVAGRVATASLQAQKEASSL